MSSVAHKNKVQQNHLLELDQHLLMITQKVILKNYVQKQRIPEITQ